MRNLFANAARQKEFITKLSKLNFLQFLSLYFIIVRIIECNIYTQLADDLLQKFVKT